MVRLFPRLSSLRTFGPTVYFRANVVSRPGIGNFTRFRGFTTSSRSSQSNRQHRYQRFGESTAQSPSYQSFWNRLTPLQRTLIILIGGGGPVFYVTHLETVPQTGRRRFIFMSKAMEESLGQMSYKQVMSQFGDKLLPENHPVTRRCVEVVKRLGAVTGLENVNWQVNVINADIPNAFVIPGGQIFIFTGILPVAANDAGLATILGHEIAHYTLRHIAEKGSLAQFFTLIGVVVAWTFGIPADVLLQFQRLVLDLPNSRACETEADYVGLLYMAEACYNPEEGPKVWQRMTKLAKGQPQPPKFLSTHPEDADRQQRLMTHIPEAKEKAAEHGCQSGFYDFQRFIQNRGDMF